MERDYHVTVYPHSNAIFLLPRMPTMYDPLLRNQCWGARGHRDLFHSQHDFAWTMLPWMQSDLLEEKLTIVPQGMALRELQVWKYTGDFDGKALCKAHRSLTERRPWTFPIMQGHIYSPGMKLDKRWKKYDLNQFVIKDEKFHHELSINTLK